MAKTRRLIILRPNQYNDRDLRLALFTDDFQKYVLGKNVRALYVNFGASDRRIDSLKSYLNHGSIVRKGVISTWLYQKEYLLESNLLLFELEIDNVRGIHRYHFIGDASEIVGMINSSMNSIRG